MKLEDFFAPCPVAECKEITFSVMKYNKEKKSIKNYYYETSFENNQLKIYRNANDYAIFDFESKKILKLLDLFNNEAKFEFSKHCESHKYLMTLNPIILKPKELEKIFSKKINCYMEHVECDYYHVENVYDKNKKHDIYDGDIDNKSKFRSCVVFRGDDHIDGRYIFNFNFRFPIENIIYNNIESLKQNIKIFYSLL